MRKSVVTFHRNSKKSSFSSLNIHDPKDFEQILKILTKTHRNHLELSCLKATLIEVFPFFEKIQNESSEQTLMGLLSEISYEFHPSRKTLFHMGDSGSKFYLILKGSVYVLIREKGLESSLMRQTTNERKTQEKVSVFVANLNKESPLARQNSMKFDRIVEKFKSICYAKQHEEELSDEEFFTIKYPDLVIDRVLKSGDSFGEVAIRHKDARRTATIVCKEDSHFIIISKNGFQRALKSYFDEIISNNLAVFKKHPLFSEWDDIQLEQFYHHVTIKKYLKNQVIYKENDEADCFFLVKEGEIEIKKVVDHSNVNSINNEFIEKLRLNLKKKRNSINITIIENGQIFGLEEMISNIKRKYTALCKSAESTVYLILKEKFFAYANDVKTMTKVVQIKNNTENYRNKFFENTIDFAQKSLYETENPKSSRNFSEEIKTYRKKFEDKIHFNEKYFRKDCKNEKSKDDSSIYFEGIFQNPHKYVQSKALKNISSNSPYLLFDNLSFQKPQHNNLLISDEKEFKKNKLNINFINLSQGVLENDDNEKLKVQTKKANKTKIKKNETHRETEERKTDFYLPKLKLSDLERKKEKKYYKYAFSLSGHAITPTKLDKIL